MNTKTKTIGVIALILFVLLLNIGSVYYMTQTDLLKGKKGDLGNPGISIIGPKGDKGDPGLSITGAKGDKGDKGDPGKSVTGQAGAPGKDAPTNHPPVVTNVTHTVDLVRGSCGTYWAICNITVSITDPDNDQMKTTFNYRRTLFEKWTENTIIYNGNGVFTDTIQLRSSRPFINESIGWGIEIWDGSDIAFYPYNYTIE